MNSTIRRIGIDPVIRLSEFQIGRLKSRFEVISGWPEEHAEGILVHSRVSEHFLNNIKGLQWVAVRAKNTDYVPKNMKLKVMGTESLGAQAVSEHVFAMILGFYKQIVASHTNVQNGVWRKNISPNKELAGKTIGIIGHGAIGKRVAEIAKIFGMNLSIVTSSIGSLEATLRHSDIVSLHVSGPTIKKLIGEKELSMMKPGAVLINTSRGYVVDQQALLEVLNRGHLAGACLDVFNEEPAELLHSKILCTPHMGFNTEETLDQMNEALVNLVLKEIQ